LCMRMDVWDRHCVFNESCSGGKIGEG
jgi:hypothetical protein